MQVFRRIFGDDFALVNDENAVTKLLGFGKDVGGEHDGALFAHFADDVADFDDLGRVQADGGFIENQHFRAVEQRLRQANALPHPFGKVADVAFGAVEQADHFERFFHPFFGIGQVAQIGHELQVVEDGHIGVERHGFGQVTDPFPHFERSLTTSYPAMKASPLEGGM